MEKWYHKAVPDIGTKKSKSIIHPFIVKGHTGLTINPYQGCQHRCGYCYATYEWSPEFFDKIYAKGNAAEVLENQLRSWKSKDIEPVMVSSATDPYQPAEIKYNLTRKCIEVLQRYGVPYYIFTKSSIILRDFELHKKYKEKSFLVWSITTCNERVRRLIEPGTSSASSMFKTIKRFVDAGVCCGVNVDPILPLITDSKEELESILDNCNKSGVKYVFGAVLRLRDDIWQRMITIFMSLGMEHGVYEYERRIYQFTKPLKPGYYVNANDYYSTNVLQDLKQRVSERGMIFDFPVYIRIRQFKGSHARNVIHRAGPGQQLTLMKYM